MLFFYLPTTSSQNSTQKYFSRMHRYRAAANDFESKRLTNTPVRQAGSVLECRDDCKNRIVRAQATYPCGSSAVGGRVCEQRHAAERVLSESRFELQNTGKKRRWKEGVSQFPRPVVWCRWSWRPGNRRSSANRVVGWPWYCRAGVGSRCILILIRVRLNAW
jgi:hypothetical protein